MAPKCLLSLSLWLLVEAFCGFPLLTADASEISRQTAVLSLYDRLPVAFEANRGQASPDVQFLARVSGYSLQLSRREIGIVVASQSSDRLDVIHMKLAGASPSAEIVGENKLPGDSNYIFGNDRRSWHTNIPTFGQVRYRGVYPGVDLVFRGTNHRVEYDLILSQGADPGAIRLSFENVRGLSIDWRGDLILRTRGGTIRQHKPSAYQLVGGVRQTVACRYVLRDGRTVGFGAGPYDAASPLTIDPVLSYSTYLGGQGTDAATGIHVDPAGNAYIVGSSSGLGFPPTQGSLQDGLFVIKLNHAGDTILYSTYIGQATPTGSAVDAAGNVYLTGSAYDGFPLVNPIQSFVGGLGCGSHGTLICPDAFVAKLNYTGSALVYSTYLGGTGGDQGNGIAVDAWGNAYVTGSTRAKDFPVTPGAFQRTSNSTSLSGSGDAFVCKIDTDGSALVYSTYLGGENYTSGNSIAVDYSGNAFVAGQTSARTFPTTRGAFQTTLSGTSADAFIARLNAAGSALVYSTYLGGSGDDSANTLAIDASGNAYVAGLTSSADFPTASALQPALGGLPGQGDAFVAKLNTVGSRILYSTYLGGSHTEYASSITIDDSGNAYLAGVTYSTDFPTIRALPGNPAESGGIIPHAFVSWINPPGSDLLFSTYLGGSAANQGSSIALHNENELHVVGTTSSSDYPVLSPLQSAFGGGQSDAFITRIFLSELTKVSPKDAAHSNSWPIRKYVLNDRSTVAFAGGDFQGQADGIVSSSPTSFLKFVALGDPVPELPGNIFAGFPMGDFGDLALNERDDVAFAADFVTCSSAAELASCLDRNERVNGLFLFSGGQIRKIALEGDPVPGRTGYRLRSFRRIRLNNSGDIAFQGMTYAPDGPVDLTSGLFFYRGGQIQTIAHEGDPAPRGSVFHLGFLDFPFTLADDGTVCFFLLYTGGAFSFGNGGLTQLLGPGDRGPAGEPFIEFSEAAVNACGEAVFRASFGPQPFEQGLFLLRQDGNICRILKDGDPTPAGGWFSMWFESTDRFGFKHPTYNSLSPAINDSGVVAFASPIKGSDAPGALFVFDGSRVQKIVASGDTMPDLPQKRFAFAGYRGEHPFVDIQYVLNNQGDVAFNPGQAGLFLAVDGQIATLNMRGDLTRDIEGTTYALQEFESLQLNNSGTTAFKAPICCGEYVLGIFLAFPRLPYAPNGGFEVPGENDLPAVWTTSWANSGEAQASRYYGMDAFEGSAALRLHVQAGGGSVFVLSDPLPASPYKSYLLECRMRFDFDSPSEAAFLSAIQFDSNGAVVGFNELKGFRGESRWTWTPRRLLIHTPPGTAFIRIRFGLVSDQERYLDVDAVR